MPEKANLIFYIGSGEMIKKKSMQKVYFYILLILILFGCAPNNQEKRDYLSLVQATNPAPTTLEAKSNPVSADDIKKEVEGLNNIYDVAVIKGNNKNLVVYKVKHLKRFQMKKIEKEVNTHLEKKFPDENFIVSSDYKIFLEAVRLSKKMKDPSFSRKDAQKRFNAIIKLKEELT